MKWIKYKQNNSIELEVITSNEFGTFNSPTFFDYVFVGQKLLEQQLALKTNASESSKSTNR